MRHTLQSLNLQAHCQSWDKLGTCRNFTRGGQWCDLKDGNHPAGSRGRAPVEVWGKVWRHFLEIMHVLIRDLDNICSTKKHFTTFPRRQVPCPLASAWGGGAHGNNQRNSKEKCRRYVIRYGRQTCHRKRIERVQNHSRPRNEWMNENIYCLRTYGTDTNRNIIIGKR